MRHFHLPLVGLALALGACGPINRSLESVHQPVVARQDYVFDVSAGALAGPRTAEGQRLADWLKSLAIGYGDAIAVDDSAAPGQPDARDTVAAILSGYGLLLSPSAPLTTGAIAPGSLRIVVSRSTATVEGCPDWRLPSQPNFAQSTMSNYGCATATNLAAMIANPADLVRGQQGYGTDARTVNKAIEAYRKQAPTGGALKTETTGGK